MRTMTEFEMEPMEVFIRRVLSKYLEYSAEKNTYERWLNIKENKEIRETLAVAEMKVTMIQSWLGLLNYDERFVMEHHLIQELEWPRIAFSFSERWKGEFTRAERTLVAYQASGMKKIMKFVKDHEEMVTSLFSDIYQDIQQDNK